MSVRKNDRSEGNLQVLKLSRDLSEYTFNICNNSKIFPKHTRFTLADKMINTTIDIMSYIAEANGMKLSEEFVAERHMLQAKALASLKKMDVLIDFAYTVLPNIEARRIEHWGRLNENVIKSLRAWVKSDNKRMKK